MELQIHQSDTSQIHARPHSNLLLRIRHLLTGDSGCIFGLCLLPLLAYAPAWLFRLSSNPLYLVSALSINHRRGVLVGMPWIDPNAGYTIQALGKLSADAWLSGHVPWWNSYMGVGVPLAAEMQPSSFYLPFVLLLHFQSGVFWLKLILQILSALATFALLRQLKLTRPAAFAGAALYEFNGTFAFFSDMPIMPLPFLPLLLLGVEKAADPGGQRRWIGSALIGLSIAYSLLAGFPETAFLNGLLALSWAIYRLFTLRRPQRLPFALKVIVGGLSGILCSLPLLLPFFEYLQIAHVTHSGLSGFGLNKISLAGILFPYIFGPIDRFIDTVGTPLLVNHFGSVGGFLDIVTFALALTALFAPRPRSRTGLRILLFCWILTFVAYTFAVPGVGGALRLIPWIDSIAVFRYSEPSWAMAAAILAAFAVNDRLTTEVRAFAVTLWPAFLALLLGACSIYVASDLLNLLLEDRGYDLWFRSSFLWPAGFLAAITFFLLRSPTRARSYWLTGFITLNAVGLFVIPQLSGLRNNKLDYGLVNFLQQHIGLNRIYTFGPLAPNYGSYFLIPSINYNALPIPADWIQYIHSSMDPSAHPILFTGFIPQPAGDRQRELRAHIAGFENAGVRYVIGQPDADPFSETELLIETTGRPRLVYQGIVAAIWELPHPAPYFEIVGGSCRLTITTRQSVQANCPGPVTLLRRELFYPGWQASINGAPFAPVSSTSIFQSLHLPPGQSSVEFRYVPTNSGRALVGSLLGVAMIAASALRWRPRAA